MKERVGDEKLIIISVAVSGTPLPRQEHRPVPPNANPAVWILIRGSVLSVDVG